MSEPAAPHSQSSQTNAPNPARRNEATRRAILDAALELVVALSVESIARRAGVGKQTIYRWWPSKGAVVLDAFLENRVEARSGVPVLDPFDTGDFAADVRRVVKDTVRAFASSEWEAPYRAVTVAIQDDPDLAARFAEQIIQPSLHDVRVWLATAQEHGTVRPDVDLDVGVELLLAPVFQRWLLRTGPLTDDYADAVAEAALAALIAKER